MTLFTNEQPPPTKDKMAEQVETIYQAYPRKTSRPEALVAIKKRMKHAGYKYLLSCTEEFAKVTAKSRTDIKYGAIPYPATFFNKKLYEDDYSTMACYIAPPFKSRAHERERKEHEAEQRKVDASLRRDKAARRKAVEYCNALEPEKYERLKAETLQSAENKFISNHMRGHRDYLCLRIYQAEKEKGE